jgi:hypothetical protein
VARRAAADDDVKTKRFSDCFEAARSAFRVPATALGMTALGSGLSETSDAYFNRSTFVGQDLLYT